jgi:hypothetical protein
VLRNINELMDMIIGSDNIKSACIIKLQEKLESKKPLDKKEVERIFVELRTMRYLFTIEKTIKKIIMYLTRNKASIAAELADYRRADSLLKFLVKEANGMFNQEQEHRKSKKKQ